MCIRDRYMGKNGTYIRYCANDKVEIRQGSLIFHDIIELTVCKVDYENAFVQIDANDKDELSPEVLSKYDINQFPITLYNGQELVLRVKNGLLEKDILQLEVTDNKFYFKAKIDHNLIHRLSMEKKESPWIELKGNSILSLGLIYNYKVFIE
eukprot:TRINITY_DN3439_c0_g1_i6.p1 TRINITY_DN3439_c0_g1~~TRINITY_DN3439_c0_g1_i6.p1  ORF type:complete len:152 (-),score=35.56 TRINITY_DN3439_c0_g1_i6:96-551(-)